MGNSIMSSLWDKNFCSVRYYAVTKCLQFGDTGDVSLQEAIVSDSGITFHFIMKRQGCQFRPREHLHAIFPDSKSDIQKIWIDLLKYRHSHF